MYIYKNGDRCPCCGEKLRDKSPEWLELFSRTVEILGLEPLPMPEIHPVDWQRPPDAGLQPVNPPQPMSSQATKRGEDLMGVYIEGMEMPKTGTYILSVDSSDDDMTVFTIANRGSGGKLIVHHTGEAIPVPPHGRLIDADALYSHIKAEQRKCNDPYDGWSECQVALGFVNTAPTIIPAQTGKEGQ